MRNFAFTLTAIISLFLFSCEKQDEEGFLKRNLKELSFPYQESTREFTVRATGNWSIDIPSEYAWISVSPQSGTGDGETYQKILVRCERNTRDERTGTLYLNGSGQSDVAITVSQSNGLFEWTTFPNGKHIAIQNQLRVNMTSSSVIAVPYLKAVGNETVTISTTISGKGSPGLSINHTTAQITEEGDGHLLIPISGTPSTQGEVTVTLTVNGQDFGNASTVSAIGQTILTQRFDKFLWGGDAIGNRPGVSSTSATAQLSIDDQTAVVTVGTNGANGSGVTSTIRNSNAAFYSQIEMDGWLGFRNYMRPGYIQLGATAATANEYGSLISPGLAIPPGQTYDILVTLKIGLYTDPYPSRLLVGLYPNGIEGLRTGDDVSNITQKTYIPATIGFHRWVEVSCVVPNANSNSALLISLPEELAQNGVVQAARIYIDDIVVTY